MLKATAIFVERETGAGFEAGIARVSSQTSWLGITIRLSIRLALVSFTMVDSTSFWSRLV
jgi:hypothetical protein